MKNKISLKRILFCQTLIIFLIYSGCTFNEDPSAIPTEQRGMEEINVPEDFNFETSQEISIKIEDKKPSANSRYNFYLLSETKEKILIGSQSNANKNSSVSSFIIPRDAQNLRVERINGGKVETYTLAVEGENTIDLEFSGNDDVVESEVANPSNGRITGDCYEKLYAVNNSGGFYSINNESGNYEEVVLPKLQGGGSIACAVNRSEKKVYYNTNTTLRYYDIELESFHVLSQGNPFNGAYPRMEYNNTNGLLYIARDAKMYIIDPISNEINSTLNIQGLENPIGGGDLAISLDGTIYMCAFSGLYRINIENEVAIATRISADNLPFKPTSMAIDRNDRLYLATNGSNSQLIEMDKFDGAWQVVQTYNHAINDLGSLPCTQDELNQNDSDNDGIWDVNDDYPDDGNKAFNSFTPSELGWGTLAFEDLWPLKGDYDFNDLLLNYRFIAVANQDNEIVELKAKISINSIGGVLHNGFGFQLPVSQDKIKMVTGYHLSKNIVTLSDKGMETGQEKAVIIVFEDAYDLAEPGVCNSSQSNLIEINIEFVSPISPEELGHPPYNPFIFINGEREMEVHLPNKAPTDKAQQSVFGTQDDASDVQNGKFYKTNKSLPWGINIIHKLKPMKEGRDINLGYNFFYSWAESGGNNYSGWYKNNSGYINENEICLD
ncbi:LruC domain-containing protein [Flexithrix dorotheae]|uniref:LruC domain-containing protein n=1 Tax=Flexithrix dorotheae TaxID=70993 RepID=UPI0012FBB77D|nr:LruC domain-containing protein [Flexithrix dorotheae]